MLTLTEAINAVAQRLADEAYDNWKRGSDHPWYCVDTGEASRTLATVYEQDAEAIAGRVYTLSYKLYEARKINVS